MMELMTSIKLPNGYLHPTPTFRGNVNIMKTEFDIISLCKSWEGTVSYFPTYGSKRAGYVGDNLMME